MGPGVHGVYLYVNAVDGRVLYVGYSSHGAKRRRHHRSGGAVWTYQHDTEGRPIVGAYVEPTWTPFADEASARIEEKSLIARLSPVYNKQRETVLTVDPIDPTLADAILAVEANAPVAHQSNGIEYIREALAAALSIAEDIEVEVDAMGLDDRTLMIHAQKLLDAVRSFTEIV